MNRYKLNNRIFHSLGLAVFLVALPLFLKAQNSVGSSGFEPQFKKNLAKLRKLYCLNDTVTCFGKFYFNTLPDIHAELEQINLPFFASVTTQTERIYRFLEGLDIGDKKNLIRIFSFYEDDFEIALKSNGLPVELKLLAPVLSAMNQTAVTAEGKAGVWQLTHFQAVLNGIRVGRLVDERLNVTLATQAAARQLKQNLEQFGSQDLAVAAYLLGSVKVRNAMQQATESGGEVFNFLPESFAETVAAFQAMALFLSVNKYKVKVDPFARKIIPDTVDVHRQIHFNQVSKVLAIPVKELQFLNPQFKFDIVPVGATPARLALPNGKWDDFVLWQDSVYNSCDSSFFDLVVQKIEYPPSPNRQYLHEPVKDLEIEGKTKIEYRIKTGDVLGIIAEDFDVRVADLKYWNNIYDERKIQAGKKLDIFVDDDKVDYYSNLSSLQGKGKQEVSMVEKIKKSSTLKVFEEMDSTKKIEHIVKSGESPFLIAKKYEGVTPEEILEWNNIDDARKIQIGQKLIVYLKQ